MKILTILIATFSIGLNVYAKDLISYKEYKCQDSTVKAFKMGLSKELNEGYYSLKLNIKGVDYNFDNFLEKPVDGSLCDRIPVFKIDDESIIVITAVDDRPMPDLLFASLLDLKKGKISGEYKGSAFNELAFNKGKLFYSSRIARTDSIGFPQVEIEKKKYVVEERELPFFYSVSKSNEQKLEAKYDVEKTFENFDYRNFYLDLESFSKEFKDPKTNQWIYLLKSDVSSGAQCIYATSERQEYPIDSIKKWNCRKD